MKWVFEPGEPEQMLALSPTEAKAIAKLLLKQRNDIQKKYDHFEDLPDPSWISAPLKRWIKSAGITRNITFHCFRHTYATPQLAGGTDIYTVSKMLGHTNVRTTQVYAKVVDEKKEKATDVIKIDNLKIKEE